MRSSPVHAAWHGDAAAFQAIPSRTEEGWRAVVGPLQAALPRLPAITSWFVALDLRLLRLRTRIDAVLVTDRAVLAILVRPGARAFLAADRLQAEDAALDLADFHAGCRGVPVLPVLLVPNGARARVQLPLALAGAAPVVEATRLTLPDLLREVATRFPPLDVRPAGWFAASYAPVPGLLEAACMLYARHDVAALLQTGAGAAGVARTAACINAAIRTARAGDRKLVVFITGEPFRLWSLSAVIRQEYARHMAAQLQTARTTPAAACSSSPSHRRKRASRTVARWILSLSL